VELPEVPDDFVTGLDRCVRVLPEVEKSADRYAYAFKVRRRVFAYLFSVEDPSGALITMLVCRADPEERAALVAGGHPYFPPRSGRDRLGVVLDDATDWQEIGELVTESYRLVAPKKLAEGLRFDGGAG
jgi:hypothetical protein